MTKLAVLAIGGNSLIKDKQHETVEDQYDAVCETAKHIAGMIEIVLDKLTVAEAKNILKKGILLKVVCSLKFKPL